jgi:ubiquinone/menaquinone biosynthesis C-methylase UbiE
MRYYDEIGWIPNKDGIIEDVVRFDDLRPVSRGYIHRCHLRVGKHIPGRGKYLLDVASGPVLYPEYVAYSEDYDNRICVDISIAALRAAKGKLGDKGIYILGDITNLPLKNASVDAFVSLHTIYHVPEEKQAAAFKELERVLKNGSTGVMVYSWGDHCLTMGFLTTVYSALRRLLKIVLPAFLVDWLRGGVSRAQTQANTAATNKEPQLYNHPHDYNWFQREIASRADWDVRVWRSVSVQFLRQYVHAKLLGARKTAALHPVSDGGCISTFIRQVWSVPSDGLQEGQAQRGLRIGRARCPSADQGFLDR